MQVDLEIVVLVVDLVVGLVVDLFVDLVVDGVVYIKVDTLAYILGILFFDLCDVTGCGPDGGPGVGPGG